MEAEIVQQLVTSGATTVVGLMATEAWTQVRSRLATLLGRGRDVAEVSAELEVIRGEVVEADGDDEVLADHAAELRGRLRRMIRQNPEAAAELRSILDEFAPATRTGEGAAVHNVISGGTVHDGTVVQAHTVNGLAIGQVPGGHRPRH
ncbi:hypothetical protein [Kitasatospora sp. NPDC092286]|uniref:hypothetical protein n=1 Tax=Kitasatospora sp. NPDC092286 TaxID=3364087 RepID=UPI00380D06FF